MANTDRPNGFRFVKTLSGAPVSGLIRAIGITNGTDIFVGDPLVVASGLATPASSNDQVTGVAVGFGKKGTMGLERGGAFGDPANLNTPNYYDDSASTNTDWVVYYIPAEDAIFEIQTDLLDVLVVGETIDFVDNGGSTTTGISGFEINGTTATNSDLTVIEIPELVDNDPELVWGRYWVMFTDTLTR